MPDRDTQARFRFGHDPTTPLPRFAPRKRCLRWFKGEEWTSTSPRARPFAGWARGRLYDAQAGAEQLRKALASYLNQGNKWIAPAFYGLLAELEVVSRGPDSALTLIDQGLAIAGETDEHFSDPYLHRLRGDILLKRSPDDPAPAEEAYRVAIGVAKQQGARSYELFGSLSLARLYQAISRPADAHAILAPALEGFTPTPEMPEIAEAQALLVAIEAGPHVRHE